MPRPSTSAAYAGAVRSARSRVSSVSRAQSVTTGHEPRVGPGGELVVVVRARAGHRRRRAAPPSRCCRGRRGPRRSGRPSRASTRRRGRAASRCSARSRCRRRPAPRARRARRASAASTSNAWMGVSTWVSPQVSGWPAASSSALRRRAAARSMPNGLPAAISPSTAAPIRAVGSSHGASTWSSVTGSASGREHRLHGEPADEGRAPRGERRRARGARRPSGRPSARIASRTGRPGSPGSARSSSAGTWSRAGSRVSPWNVGEVGGGQVGRGRPSGRAGGRARCGGANVVPIGVALRARAARWR